MSKGYFAAISLSVVSSFLFLFSFCNNEQIAEPNYGSHDWTFVYDTLGNSNSFIRAIMAFSKNDVWAIGTFTIHDNGDDSGKSNVAHWDGAKWTYSKIMFTGYPENSGPPDATDGNVGCKYPEKDHMLVESGCLHTYDGVKWTRRNTQVYRWLNGMWAANSSSAYVVGLTGYFASFNGSKLQEIPLPTKLTLRDIYGDGGKIFICGGSNAHDSSIAILYEKGNANIINLSPSKDAPYYLESIWYNDKDNVIACAGWGTKILLGNTWILPDSAMYRRIPYSNRVRGTSIYNIWFACSNNSFVHFDGRTYKLFNEYFPIQSVFYDLDVNEDFVVISGLIITHNSKGMLFSKGIVVRGYKNSCAVPCLMHGAL